MKKKVIFLLMLLILTAIVVFLSSRTGDESVSTDSIVTDSILSGVEATIYKSPNCGCCVGYNAEMEKLGTKTEIVATEDMQEIKDRYDIPRNMESCHTTVIGDYFIEGHIPFEVVEKLLTEKPDIDGIALPNMPSGTPGMPGIKTGPYEIYQLKDGIVSPYITI